MVAIVNVEMAAVWDGEEGDEWTENADRYDATDHWMGKRFEAEVAIEPTDRVLDIGCGTGKSTRDAARRALAGSVLGVDLSARMLDDARRRSVEEGLANVEFLQADAQVHRFEPSTYDLAVSVFGAMFFADPVAAFANIGTQPAARRPNRVPRLAALRGERVAHRALRRPRRRPGPAHAAAGAPGSFGLADRDTVAEIVRDAGFVDERLLSLTEPMFARADADGAWAFMSEMGIVRGLTGGLDAESKGRAMSNLRHSIDSHETGDGVLFRLRRLAHHGTKALSERGLIVYTPSCTTGPPCDVRGRLGAAAQPQLGQDPSDVVFRGLRADEEAVADLRVGETVPEQVEHLFLAHV